MEAPKKEKRIRNRKDKKKSELIEKEENVTEKITVNSSNVEPNAKEHVQQLQRLQEKDPEFYEFLKEHGQDLLEFDDDEDDEDNEIDDDVDGTETQEGSDADMNDEKPAKEKKPQDTQKVITMSMVDTWCKEIREDSKLSAVRSLMRAFRTACHYGDQQEDTDPSLKFSVMSSSVFNKVMLVVLGEMDGILRGLLKFPSSGGKKETVLNATLTREWKNYHSLLKSYLGNALHVLNQMTDTEMIAFTLRRLKYSAMFLAAFPSLLRKYVKVSLHFWGTGGGALPVVSFLFLRDLCIRIGSDCIDDCFKGIYKAYILNAQFMNASKLQHIEFLGNCVIELYGVDLSTAYQHAFVFIRQLAMILKEALTMKTKESFRKVYEWKFMNCLELWTGAICAYSSEADFRPLAYPLTQIISGVARLVPTAKYFPLRLRCARMLNRIAAATDTFIPTSLLLLDMLEMKELNRSPSGGVGKAVDLRTSLKVSKPTLKTRSFQEACVFSVIEEVAEHLVQWSYSVAFFELSFIPLVRLRCFYKSTKVERFRREVKQLIHQIEINAEFTNAKRSKVTFLPNDIEATSFLEVEKKAGSSPLSKYVAVLHQRAQTRTDSLVHSNVIVGEKSSKFGGRISDSDEEDNNGDIDKGATVFSSSWLPGKDSTAKKTVEKKMRKLKAKEDKVAHDEDIVEELVLSSDDDEEPKSDDESLSDTSLDKENKAKPSAPKRNNKKRKPSKDPSKKKKFHTFKPKKKQRT